MKWFMNKIIHQVPNSKCKYQLLAINLFLRHSLYQSHKNRYTFNINLEVSMKNQKMKEQIRVPTSSELQKKASLNRKEQNDYINSLRIFRYDKNDIIELVMNADLLNDSEFKTKILDKAQLRKQELKPLEEKSLDLQRKQYELNKLRHQLDEKIHTYNVEKDKQQKTSKLNNHESKKLFQITQTIIEALGLIFLLLTALFLTYKVYAKNDKTFQFVFQKGGQKINGTIKTSIIDVGGLEIIVQFIFTGGFIGIVVALISRLWTKTQS